MNSKTRKQPLYIRHQSDVVYGVLHLPAKSEMRHSPVIICPPAGVDNMNCHRSLRHLAEMLAQNGCPALRIDYIGTGDSSDRESDTDQINDFVQSVLIADDYLKSVFETEKNSIVGVKLGAMIASLASEVIDFADLIIWAPVYQGKQFIREILLLKNTSDQGTNNSNTLETGGWVINQATQQRLQSINLVDTNPVINRCLLFDEANKTKQQKIFDAWSRNNLNVQSEHASGVSDMLQEPHLSQVPNDDLILISSWIALGDCDNSSIESLPKQTPPISELVSFHNKITNTMKIVREDIVWKNDLLHPYYIRSSPVDSHQDLPVIIVLNSGSNPHTGPHRLYVDACRFLSSIGYICLRVDLPGLGESVDQMGFSENNPYVEQPMQAIKLLLETVDSNKRNYFNGTLLQVLIIVSWPQSKPTTLE